VLAIRGRWDDAEALLRRIMSEAPDPGVLGWRPRPILGRLLARRGDPEAEQVLEPLTHLEDSPTTTAFLIECASALVEWRWLQGRPQDALEYARDVLALVPEGPVRLRAELHRYLRIAGLPVPSALDGAPAVYLAGLRGDWAAAAAAWTRVDAPYERALELMQADQPEPVLEAVVELDRLGAAPVAARARERLRALGVRRVPRGPQPATRANPAGLTERQLDVLALLPEGLTNAEIAQRLVVSTRTVDHHVSAILTKLGVATRQEAARRAGGLLDASG
jgi:DNA-binding CsgD family transcriptional regulator